MKIYITVLVVSVAFAQTFCNADKEFVENIGNAFKNIIHNHVLTRPHEPSSEELSSFFSNLDEVVRPTLPPGVDINAIVEALVDAIQDISLPDIEDIYGPQIFELGPKIKTTSGEVQGAKYPEGYAFYSVPYAKPPERFQPPEQLSEPNNFINATVPNGIVCQQRRKNCTNGVCIFWTSEDCLVLNINVPSSVEFSEAGVAAQSLPVLVWFHGGGFFGGGATIPEFESRYFADKANAIIVTVNYRLGAFGFLVHGEGDDAITGNQGIKDQQMALSWVQQNIAKFGGNPNMVTIFGNSAGAQSVMFHLVSEVSKPLFHRAIMQSNPAVFQYQTLEEAKRVTRRLIRVLNCPNDTLAKEIECLKTFDPRVLNVANFLVMGYSLYEDHDIWSTVEAFRPVLDGVDFKQQPFEMFRDGTWNNDKDLIVGTNTQELESIEFFYPEYGPNGNSIPFNRAMYQKLNQFIFGETMGMNVSDHYRNSVNDGIHTDYEKLLGVQASHMFFICPSRLMARFASNTSATGKVYLYSNNHAMDGPTCQDVVSPREMCGLSFHGSEPPFVFRSGPFYGYEFRDVDTAVADQFDYYWSNFARTGNPSETNPADGSVTNLGPFKDWPRYSFLKNAFRRSKSKKLPYASFYEKTFHGPYNIHPQIVYSAKNPEPRASNSWRNIQIDAADNVVQDRYMEEMCDFWDSLNYYVNPIGPTAQPVTTTSKADFVQHSLVVVLLALLSVAFLG